MERSSKNGHRNAFLGSRPQGALPPALPAQTARPLERMLMMPRQTPVVQAPSLKETASNNDWLEWATTFG